MTVGRDADLDPDLETERDGGKPTLDGGATDAGAPSNGIGDDGTYRWRGDDGRELAFGQDGSLVLDVGDETDGADGTTTRKTDDGSSDVGDVAAGEIDFDGDLLSLDAAGVAAVAEQVKASEAAPGDGATFDGDDEDDLAYEKVYADGLGNVTTVETDGTLETVDVNGSHGFRDAEGNLFQGNPDGTFIHKRADGTATWRTADETGETTRGEDGELVSTRTSLDGDGEAEAVDGPPSGLLTLPGIRDEGLMALVDENMSDGFLSEAELTLIRALAESGIGG